MLDVFISYSRQDAKIAEGFRNLLQSAGLSAFLDTASLAPGAQWSQELRTKLNEANVILVLASEAAIRSPMVHQEFGAAIAHCKTVIPIVWKLDPASLPGWMSEYQALELRGGDPIKIKSEIRELVEKLANGTLQKLTVDECQQDRDKALVAARDGHPTAAGDPRSDPDETLESLVAAILAKLAQPAPLATDLLPEAVDLLIHAVKSNGQLIRGTYLEGRTVIGQMKFTKEDERRKAAYWTAFDQLVDAGLVESRGGDIFYVSSDRYKLADQLLAAKQLRSAESGTTP